MVDFDIADKIYFGTTEVDKLYLGTTELYKKKQPTPTAAYTVVGDLVKEGNYYKGFSHDNNAYIDCGKVRFDPQSEWRIRFTAKNTTSHSSISRDMVIFFADPDTKICYGCLGGYSTWARPVAYGSGVEGTGVGTSYSIYLQTSAPSGVIINPLTDTTGADISLEMAWNGTQVTWMASNTGYDNLKKATSRSYTTNNWQIFDSPNIHMYIGALPSDIPSAAGTQTAIDGIDVDSIYLSSISGTWDAVNGFVDSGLHPVTGKANYTLTGNAVVEKYTGYVSPAASGDIPKLNILSSLLRKDYTNIEVILHIYYKTWGNHFGIIGYDKVTGAGPYDGIELYLDSDSYLKARSRLENGFYDSGPATTRNNDIWTWIKVTQSKFSGSYSGGYTIYMLEDNGTYKHPSELPEEFGDKRIIPYIEYNLNGFFEWHAHGSDTKFDPINSYIKYDNNDPIYLFIPDNN